MSKLFVEAAKTKLRVQTEKGSLSSEQLLDLPLKIKVGLSLNSIARTLDEQLSKNSKNYVDDSSETDSTLQLQFDIVMEIIKMKKKENKIMAKAAANKKELSNLTALLAKIEEKEMDNMSKEDVEKRIEKLLG